MTWLRIITILVFVIVFLLWAGQNLENVVDINNFDGKTVATTPLWIVVLVSAAFGIFFMGILGIVQEFKDKAQIKKLNRTIDKQQEELASLRNLPISDEIGEAISVEEEREESVNSVQSEVEE
jgi:uncharacterized integral membrane protein